MLADRGIALALELGVDQRELPGRRGLFRHDAIAAAVEAQVLELVARVIDARQPGADVEVDVAQIAVLRDAETHRDRARIARADPEIHVGQR